MTSQNSDRPNSAADDNPDKIDDRSAMAQAMDKVSQITAASLSLVVPTLIGYGLDRWLETGVVMTIVGFILGALAGSWQLYKLVQRLE